MTAARAWGRAVALAVVAALPACGRASQAMPACTPGNRLAIVAQAVPSAQYLPCVAAMPVGWNFGQFDVEDGRVSFWLDHDREGARTAEVAFAAGCDTTGAFDQGPADGAERYVRPGSVSPAFAATTYDVVPGGCVTYRYSFTKGENAEHIRLLNELFEAISLFPRAAVEEEVRRDLGQELSPSSS